MPVPKISGILWVAEPNFLKLSNAFSIGTGTRYWYRYDLVELKKENILYVPVAYPVFLYFFIWKTLNYYQSEKVFHWLMVFLFISWLIDYVFFSTFNSVCLVDWLIDLFTGLYDKGLCAEPCSISNQDDVLNVLAQLDQMCQLYQLGRRRWRNTKVLFGGRTLRCVFFASCNVTRVLFSVHI